MRLKLLEKDFPSYLA